MKKKHVPKNQVELKNTQVIQFECGDTQGGPSDCLQYFTGPTGTVASFNYPIGSTTVGATGIFPEEISYYDDISC